MLTVALVLCAIALATGAPFFVAFSIGGIVAMLYALDVSPLAIANAFFQGINKYTLVAIPLFILVGTIMEQSGGSKRLLRLADNFVGHRRGGMEVTLISSSAFFSAIVGSNLANAAAMGSIWIPEMAKAGHRKSYAAALTAAAGCLGGIIPPSIGYILYGSIAYISIGKQFIAGIMPGLIYAAMLVIYILIAGGRGDRKKQPSSWHERIYALGTGLPILMLPVIILGGIYTGVFTATETGAIAAIFCLLMTGLFYREMRMPQLRKAFVEAARVSGGIFLMIAGSMLLNGVLVQFQVPQTIAQTVLAWGVNQVTFFLLAGLVLLILGTFVEGTVLILVTTPIAMPIMQSLGVDPIQFGVALVMWVGVGQMTPPVALVLYVVSSIAGESPHLIFKEIIPFLLILIAAALIIGFFPALSLWLPGLMGAG